jgi:predicted phage gp36 major capsid-like protein
MRPGSYSQASGQASLERESAVHAREEARREMRRIERETQRRRETAARKEGQKSLRGIARHDNDARSRKRAAIVSGTDGIAAKQAGALETRLSRISAQLDATRVAKRYDADIWLEAQPSRRPVLARLEAHVLPLGEHTLQVAQQYGIDRELAASFVGSGRLVNHAYNFDDTEIKVLLKNGNCLDISEASDQLDRHFLEKTVTKYYLFFPKEKADDGRGKMADG